LSNWNGKEVILIGVYVDECLVNGNKERIQWFIVELKRSGFNFKAENNLKDYMNYHIIEDKEWNQIMILQHHFVNNLRHKFGNEVLQRRSYRTPGTPRFKVIRPDQDLELTDPKSQSRYRSGVGMLLYLTKHSRPDICHVVREVCKCMDNATIGTYLELSRVIKLLLYTI
jgi:hypothetical protein